MGTTDLLAPDQSKIKSRGGFYEFQDFGSVAGISAYDVWCV